MNNPPGISIIFDFDELPPDGRPCFVCKEPIEARAFYPYIQVMDPKEVNYLWPWCEKCYLEFQGDDVN